MSHLIGTVDVSGLTTKVEQTVLTDSEFDILWEVNKKRVFTHKAWPTLLDSNSSKSEGYYVDNIEDAKTSAKSQHDHILNIAFDGSLYDSWLVKIYDGSTIIGSRLMMGAKSKLNDYLVESNAELAQLWTQEGNSGDYSDGAILSDISMFNPMVNGTPSGGADGWYMAYIHSTGFYNAVLAETVPAGFKYILSPVTGKQQKYYANTIIHNWAIDNSPLSSGTFAGKNFEAMPCFNYVDDNETQMFALGITQESPLYAELDSSVKPSCWPFTTVKVGGKYPPYS